MVNTVFRKIKELSANEITPRSPIPIDALVADLNIDKVSLAPIITELVSLRLIKYNTLEKKSVHLTLLGATVNR